MKIYTKQGDAGQTGLYGGPRVPKNDPRIETYGTVDELNAVLGLVLAEEGVPQALQSELTRIQNELFSLGSELATPPGKGPGRDWLTEDAVTRLERSIDGMEAQLAPLKNFILPGGSKAASALHLARTVSRRAERCLVGFHGTTPQRGEVLRYLNRLSDYLFVAARFVNHMQGVSDVPWKI